MTYDDVKQLPTEQLVDLVKLAAWILQGEEFGYELIYNDDELLTFKKTHKETTK